MKNVVLILICLSSWTLLAPLAIYAQQEEDAYPDWIAWWGGKGMKRYTICDNSGYYVTGIWNFDHGNNNQSAFMNCTKIKEHIKKTDIEHDRCTDIKVEWFGGEGVKPWAYCPDGKYAVGFQIKDYGNRNQAIANMRCCAIGRGRTFHGDSYVTPVIWSGGPGEKTPAQCKRGYFVTGIQLRDSGKNNQSVAAIRCTQPKVK